MNNVVLAGRLTRNPELEITVNGVEYLKCTIAVSREHKKGGNQETDFINITAWRKTAVFISQYFSKGDGIVLNGKIQTGSYQTNTGEKRYTMEVIVDNVEFPLGKKFGNDQPDNAVHTMPDVPTARIPHHSSVSAQSNASIPQTNKPVPLDDDLPF